LVVVEEEPVFFAAPGLVVAALIFASRDMEVFLLSAAQSASTTFSVCHSVEAAPSSLRTQTTRYYRKTGSAIGHSETGTELLQGECN
jgi:hypothetical protein